MGFLSFLPSLLGGFSSIFGANKAAKLQKEMAEMQIAAQKEMLMAELANELFLGKLNVGETSRQFNVNDANRMEELSRRNAFQAQAAPSMLYALGNHTWAPIADFLQRANEQPTSKVGSILGTINAYTDLNPQWTPDLSFLKDTKKK